MKIKFVENFLSPEEVKSILNIYERISKDDNWDSDQPGDWNGLTFYIPGILTKYNDKKSYGVFINILKRIQPHIQDLFNLDNTVYADTMQIVKWLEGADQGIHADNVHADGSPNYTPWRKYSSLIYLNDDFEGGETYFPNFDIEFSPQSGALLVFSADLDHLHGVKKITSGERKTLISFWNDELINESLRLG